MKIFNMSFAAACAWFLLYFHVLMLMKRNSSCIVAAQHRANFTLIIVSAVFGHQRAVTNPSSAIWNTHLVNLYVATTSALSTYCLHPCRVSVGYQLIPRQIYFFNKSRILSQQWGHWIALEQNAGNKETHSRVFCWTAGKASLFLCWLLKVFVMIIFFH